ncbi:MAG: LolA family protein [Longimicrobiaceae bacterium]
MKFYRLTSYTFLLAFAFSGCGGSDRSDTPERSGERVQPGSAEAEPADEKQGSYPRQGAGAGAEDEAAPPSEKGVEEAPSEADQARQSEPSDPGAGEILRRVERVYSSMRSLQASFEQELEVPLLDETRRSSGVIYQRRPNRFLMRFTDPAGDVVVADGRHLWLYYPSSDPKQVIRARVSGDAGGVDFHAEFLRGAAERYLATRVGTERVGGRAADVLKLVPKYDSPFRLLKIWVTREDGLVRRFEITEQNHSVRRLQLSELRMNPDLPDSLFHFEVPEGAQVFNQ